MGMQSFNSVKSRNPSKAVGIPTEVPTPTGSKLPRMRTSPKPGVPRAPRVPFDTSSGGFHPGKV